MRRGAGIGGVTARSTCHPQRPGAHTEGPSPDTRRRWPPGPRGRRLCGHEAPASRTLFTAASETGPIAQQTLHSVLRIHSYVPERQPVSAGWGRGAQAGASRQQRHRRGPHLTRSHASAASSPRLHQRGGFPGAEALPVAGPQGTPAGPSSHVRWLAGPRQRGLEEKQEEVPGTAGTKRAG